jgi:Predicted integral membrane protein
MTDHSETDKHTAMLGLERLLFFSDAVFAIAITLLALELRLPDEPVKLDDEVLQEALKHLFPEYIAFVISFLVIGAFWMGHHRKFRFIKAYNAPLMRINLALLLAVGFVPHTTNVMSHGVNRTAVVLYAASMIAVGLLSALMSWYALSRTDLTTADMTPQDRRQMLLEPLGSVVVFAFSILVALWDPRWAQWSWLLLIPVNRTPSRRAYDQRDAGPALPLE